MKSNYPTAAVYKDRVAELSIWWDHKLDKVIISNELMGLFLELGILRLEEESPYFLWQLREV